MKIAVIVFILLIIYGVIDNNIIWISKRRLKFKGLPDEFSGLRIVQLSDLHKKSFSKNNTRLIRAVKRQKPDYIILCGDMVNRDEKKFSAIKHLLEELSIICPVFYSLGNHEIDMRQEVKSELYSVIKDTGVVLLNNEEYMISRNGKMIKIVGISLYRQNYRIKKGVYKGLRSYTVRDMVNNVGTRQGFTILLAHNPFFFDAYAKWGADLILSGHVHGGVIRVPFVCGLLSPERKLFPKYSSGVYKKNSSVMLVSRGLGKIRLFNPPEVNIIELISD